MFQFPLYQRFPRLLAGSFDQRFGNFSPRYSSPARVNLCLRRLALATGISQRQIVSVTQSHSDRVIALETRPPSPQPKTAADGLLTQLPNLFLLIVTADCLPVFLFCPKTSTIGLLHVGWRGANRDIHLKALTLLRRRYHCSPPDLLVCFGPAICADCYVFADPPRQLTRPGWRRHLDFRRGRWHVDLGGYVQTTLQEAGIRPAHISRSPFCTAQNPRRWYSHYRSRRGDTPVGRFANLIGIREF